VLWLLAYCATAFGIMGALLLRGQASTPMAEPPVGTDPVASERALVAQGLLAKAEDALKSYLHDNPKSADGHFLLGYVFFREQKAKESLAEFTAAVAVRRPKPDELKTVASDYVLLRDFEDADKWFSEVTAETPTDWDAWYLLGRTQFNEGYYEKAVASFQRSLELRPKFIESENNLGLAYRELNETAESRTAFETAIEWQGTAPVDAQPYLNLGTLLVEQGETEKGIAQLKKAEELAPTNPKAHEQLGSAYEAQDQMAKAEGEMEQAVSLAPETSALHFKLGGIYRKEGKKDLAQAQFKICERLNGTHSSKETPNPFLPRASQR
jgi:tetratricopeptide (TPR) repeat protein